MPNAVLFAILGIPDGGAAVGRRSPWSARSDRLGGAVPAAGHGLGARRDLHLLHRRDRRCRARRRCWSTPTARGSRCSCCSCPSTIVGGVLILRGSLFIRDDLAMVVAEIREELDEHERQQADPDDHPGAAGQPHRLLLRPGADPVRRRLRGPQGRGARPARHERRRQVDDPAGHRRARHAVARRRPPERADRSRTCRPRSGRGSASSMLPGGKGVFPDLSDPGEPGDGDVQLPVTTGPTMERRIAVRTRAVPGAGRAPGRARRIALRRAAAAARARPDAGLRARDPDHRRALPRARADHGRAAGRGRSSS